MKEKIKPLVWSYVQFMESFYSALLDSFYICALGLEYERVVLSLVTVSFTAPLRSFRPVTMTKS